MTHPRLYAWLKSPTFWVLASAFLLFVAGANRFDVGFLNDDARDILAARSLLHGSYRNLQIPHEPLTDFPLPGFPALLAPWVALAGDHVGALRILPIFFTLLSIALTAKLFRSMSGVASTLLLTQLAFNPTTLFVATTVMADSAYLTVLLLALNVLKKELLSESGEGPWILGALTACAVLLRPEGICFVLALGLPLLIGHRRRLGLISLSLGLGAWGLWTLRNVIQVGTAGGYGSIWKDALPYLAQGPGAIGRQVLGLLSVLGNDLLLALPMKTVLPGVIFALLILAGIHRALSHETRPLSWTRVAAFYVGAHLALHVIWPAIHPHYFWPILPFILYFLREASMAWPLTLRRTAWGLFAGCTLSISIWQNASALHESLQPSPIRMEQGRRMDWVKRHTPEKSFILVPRASAVALHTRRYAMALLRASNAERFYQGLVDLGVTHIWVDPVDFLYVQTAPKRSPAWIWSQIPSWIAERPTNYTRLTPPEDSGFQIFQVNRKSP